MTKRICRIWVVTLVAALSSIALEVPAQDAAELDKKAREAFERKDFEAAALTFEEAYRLKPHPATKYNAAFAWERAGELARAADAFEQALDSAGLDDSRASASRERLAALKRQLGYVFVSRPIGATASLLHAEKVPIPAKIHVPPGKHDVVVHLRDGSTETKSVTVRAGESVDVGVEQSALGPAPGPGPAEDSAPSTPPESPAADAGESSCGQCTWGWVAIGGAVVAAGVGTYFGLRTLSARDDFEDSKRTDPDAHDRAVTSRTLTNVAFGVAAVSGAAGVVLLLTADRSDGERVATPRTEVRLGLTGVSAAVRF